MEQKKKCIIHVTFVEIKKDEMDRTYSESQNTILKWVLEKKHFVVDCLWINKTDCCEYSD